MNLYELIETEGLHTESRYLLAKNIHDAIKNIKESTFVSIQLLARQVPVPDEVGEDE